MTTSAENKQKDAEKSQKPDVLKWLVFLVSMLGVLAWISGAAYLAGYWGILGLDGPIVSPTLQQTALIGFIGAFKTWLYSAVALLGIGVLIALLGVRIKIKKKEKRINPNNWIVKLEQRIISRFGYDSEMGTFGIFTMIGAYLFLFALVAPLLVWSLVAHSQGKTLFRDQTCNIRSGKEVITKVFQINGRSISGRIIDRSDKLLTVSDGKDVYVFNTNQVPLLLYSLKIPDIKCPSNK